LKRKDVEKMDSGYYIPADQDWLDQEKEIVKQAELEKQKMKRVIIESPYAGNVKLNEIYGEFCMHDCIVNHNESPYASHLLYTRKYVLRDHIPEERKLGIDAGFYWRDVSEKTVFYVDLDISSGMKLGIEDCEKKGKDYEVRNLPGELWLRFRWACSEEGIEPPKRSE
jgi:hypothetical protein